MRSVGIEPRVFVNIHISDGVHIAVDDIFLYVGLIVYPVADEVTDEVLDIIAGDSA